MFPFFISAYNCMWVMVLRSVSRPKRHPTQMLEVSILCGCSEAREKRRKSQLNPYSICIEKDSVIPTYMQGIKHC